jgi:hypothetical protein
LIAWPPFVMGYDVVGEMDEFDADLLAAAAATYSP